ncbi:hypothetical protein N7517_010417 [Penicillium concentricum]|uniref:Uncharacterized protein n=1 Tax=Penicillium concentricum TaxID=293559 RepID=A0A9W9USF8_9EURO|nr:uncharacterized protein N7517_010417 [Penicillium concentricum]KAJ5355808.1 hypothetical protein N7517_010417 [Penicillium concentricum]
MTGNSTSSMSLHYPQAVFAQARSGGNPSQPVLGPQAVYGMRYSNVPFQLGQHPSHIQIWDTRPTTTDDVLRQPTATHSRRYLFPICSPKL